jgi:hypothetical protein
LLEKLSLLGKKLPRGKIVEDKKRAFRGDLGIKQGASEVTA